MGGRLAVLAVALAALIAVPSAHAAAPVNVNWVELLPALPSPAGGTGGPQAGCQTARLRCVDTVIRRLREHQERFACDHRGVFATTYLELTRVMRRTLREEPDYFRDRRALIFEDVLFAEVYFDTIAAREAGERVDPAWRIAFDAARRGNLTGTGDMLLGINAHVQNDMPFVLAALTLRDADGVSRKDDHDRANEVLNRAFDQVVRAVSGRYDPLTAWHTHNLSPVTDAFGVELVRVWREAVWRNAERLVLARNAAARRRVARSIKAQAAATARLIQVGLQGPPGHRAARAAYCATRIS